MLARCARIHSRSSKKSLSGYMADQVKSLDSRLASLTSQRWPQWRHKWRRARWHCVPSQCNRPPCASSSNAPRTQVGQARLPRPSFSNMLRGAPPLSPQPRAAESIKGIAVKGSAVKCSAVKKSKRKHWSSTPATYLSLPPAPPHPHVRTATEEYVVQYTILVHYTIFQIKAITP